MEYAPYNELTLCGRLAGTPQFSHESHGITFLRFPLCIARLSGSTDTVNIIADNSLLPKELYTGVFLCVTGELRSFNNNSGIGNKLAIHGFAHRIEISEETYQNEVSLGGVICKNPIYRHTPLGREICDLMIAVGRHYGRSDYLPCIAWGKLANTACTLSTGDFIQITGRLQSRTYIKALDTGEEIRTAFEVSIFTLE